MRITFLLVFIWLGTAVWGQVPTSTPEEAAKKKEINTLKRNGDAYYADVYQEVNVEDADLAEAQQRSKDMLQAHVIEIFSKRLKMSKQDVQDIWAVIEKNCQNIVVKRGDLFRVFTYVMKNALNPNEPGEEIVMPGGPGSLPPQPEPQPDPQPEVKVDKVVPAPAPQPEVKVDTVKVVPPAPGPEPKPAPVPEPKPEPKPVPEVEVPILCQNLIAKGNFDMVYRYLQQEKTYQRLMYGPGKKMQRPEKCYIVLTDKVTGAIVAVLDKGESERMNFITKKMDHFRNYQNGKYQAIFVQEY